MMRASACLGAVHSSELIMLGLLLLAATSFRSHQALRGHGANTRRTQDSRVCAAVCDIAAVGTIV
jgi:hypothetical protein